MGNTTGAHLRLDYSIAGRCTDAPVWPRA